MKPGRKIILIAAVAGLGPVAVASAQEQVPPMGYATNFSSVTYFEPPHEQQVKIRLSGAEALPLPDARFDLKRMKVENFNADGKLEAEVLAPQCVYAVLDHVANSPGHLELRSGDGKFYVEGDGFLWQEKDRSLIISNHVHTVIKVGNSMNFSPL